MDSEYDEIEIDYTIDAIRYTWYNPLTRISIIDTLNKHWKTWMKQHGPCLDMPIN